MFRAVLFVLFTLGTAVVIFLAMGPAPASSASAGGTPKGGVKGKPGAGKPAADCPTCPLPSN